MTILKHELKQSRVSFLIWTGVIGLMVILVVILFPEFKGEMDMFNSIFESMGAFTAAFGLDYLNMGELIGYYAIEIGSTLGIGGALYAALIAIQALSGEEDQGSADFLLTHPISRVQVVFEKWLHILLRVISLNAIIFTLAIGSMALINEPIPWRELIMLHLAYLLTQIQTAAIAYALSAFFRRRNIGLGLGIALLLYFLSIIAKLTTNLDFLNYLTPYGYSDPVYILKNDSLNIPLVILGLVITLIALAIAHWQYKRKDIHA